MPYSLSYKQRLMRPEQRKQRFIDLCLDAMLIITFLCALLSIYGWMESRDEQARTEEKLAHCLNEGTFRVDAEHTVDAIKCGITIYQKGN